MKLYRYRLGIDTIIEQVYNVKLINDKLYIDEGDDYPKFVCKESDINSGEPILSWETEWLCYNEPQNEVDIRCDLTRIAKKNLHYLKKDINLLNARAARYEADINTLGECEIEREEDDIETILLMI